MKCLSYIAVHTESDHEMPVLRKIRQIESVADAFRVYGVYDIVAQVETCNKGELETITEEIKRIQSVRGTLSLNLEPKE